jgi:DNA gyrase subunit A
MAILRRVAADPAERLAYLRHASAMRAAAGEPGEEEPTADTEEVADIADADEAAAGAELTDESAEASVSFERIAELGAAEEFILTLTDSGYGKRTSSYDYRRSRRGGQGIAAFNMERRGGRLVASFPVEETDGLLLVTDAGQLIRVPVRDIRIASRNTQGVTVLRTAGHERVVSVERLAEPAGSEADGETDLPETDGTQTSGSQTDGSDPDGTEAG